MKLHIRKSRRGLTKGHWVITYGPWCHNIMFRTWRDAYNYARRL